MPTIDLPIGAVDYRVFGPGPPGHRSPCSSTASSSTGTLWDPVAERLADDGVRCIVPDWPLGAHRRPASTRRRAVAGRRRRRGAGLLDSLDLRDAILVGSDTGGGLCQLALRQLALRGDTDRVGGLVLTNCDAFEQFPPRFFVPLFVMARSRAAVWLLAQQTRLRAVRHSPLGFRTSAESPAAGRR